MWIGCDAPWTRNASPSCIREKETSGLDAVALRRAEGGEAMVSAEWTSRGEV